MKTHLLTAVTAAITFILLVCCLAIWPYLQERLLGHMGLTIDEAAGRQEPDPLKSVRGNEEVHSSTRPFSEPMRFIAWAGFAALDLRRKAMTWGGYGNAGFIFAAFTIPMALKAKPQRERRMNRLWIVFFCSMVFFLQNAPEVCAQFSEARVEKLRVAVDAPDLTLKELGGGSISLKGLQGKIILLNFFATWCPYCQREAPSMVKLHQEFKNTDLVLLKVATKEKENDLRKHKNQFNIPFPILMDDDASCANRYGVWNRPATFLINREGKIVGRLVKEVEWTSKGMRKLIEFLLKGENP